MLTKRLARLTNVQPGEVGACLWSAAYFFCVLCAYFILRPLREAMGLAGGVDNLSWLFMGTLLVTLAANPLFHGLVARFPRHVFIPVTYRFFMLNLLVFFLLLRFLPERVGINVGRVFYVWLSVFNLFAVTIFWAFMADGFRLEQSKRLFGFIGVGGTLGAIAGAAVTRSLAQPLGAAYLLLISVALLETGVQCMRRVQRHFARGCPDALLYVAGSASVPSALAPDPRGDSTDRRAGRRLPGDVLNGIALVFRSPYLLSVCAYIFFLAIQTTFLYFAQARIVASTAGGLNARSALFGRIDFWTQVATLATQLLLTSRILKRFGVGPALAIQPVLTVVAFGAIALAPSLGLLIVFRVLHDACRHAVTRPARETLFTVVSFDEKYKSKSFIDTFVYRGGDVAGALTDKLLATLGLGLVALTGAAIPLAGVWGGLALYLGVTQRRLSARSAPPGWPRDDQAGLVGVRPASET